MDLEVPGAMPTMVCRPPTINGTVRSLNNEAEVLSQSGVTDVAIVTTGVAVRAQTFGQCIDAIQVMDVTWGPGTEDTKSDDSVLAELRTAELPPAPSLSALATALEQEFVLLRQQQPLKDISEADLDGLRNICRCGTHYRIREAILWGAANM